MKVLAINKFFYIFGGSDRYFFELNDLLENHGHEVVPFSMAHPRNFRSKYENYFVSQVDYWEPVSLQARLTAAGRVLFSPEARRKVRELIQATRPDIAHIHLIYHQITQSILPVLKEFDIPVIQTLHDYKPICPTYRLISHGEICERCQGKKYFHAISQRCNNGSFLASALNSVEMYLHHGLGWYALVDRYHAPSKFMQDKMIEYGTPAEKVVHIPLLIDANKYRFSPDSADYFIYFGRLAPVKGVKTLLKAVALLGDPPLRLLIVGDGPQREELEQFKSSKNLTMIEFLGYQQTEELMKLIANARFSVLPSEWYDNHPLAIMESMAMGKPVIGARIGGIPELIDHEKNGLLFESGNVEDLAGTLDTLIHDKQKTQAMGKAAREKMVEDYRPSTHFEMIIRLYRSLLN